MKSGVYRNGKELSPIDVKQTIMQIRGWNEAEYTRQRKRLTKQITTLNALYSQSGQAKTEERTAVQMLYSESKSMKRYGANYQPSARTQLIHSLSATSGSFRSDKSIDKARSLLATYVPKRFKGLIESNNSAAEIATRISDPVQLEAALSKFANDMHVSIDAKREAQRKQAIPFSSESYGSDEYDVDISAYLPNFSDLQEISQDQLPF